MPQRGRTQRRTRQLMVAEIAGSEFRRRLQAWGAECAVRGRRAGARELRRHGRCARQPGQVMAETEQTQRGVGVRVRLMAVGKNAIAAAERMRKKIRVRRYEWRGYDAQPFARYMRNVPRCW